jgi:hypothetical protein
MQTVPTVQPSPCGVFSTPNHAHKGLLKAPSEAARTAALAARRLKLILWHSLGLRQTFADEGFMLEHFKAAGLRAPNRLEPASVPRLRQLLRRAGVSNTEAEASVGCSLRDYLKLNSDYPLWAAVALALEATGRFTPPVSAALATA